MDCDAPALEKAKAVCNGFEEVKVVEEPPRGDGEKIKISGLCCANCARELEEELNAINGVTATVDFVNLSIVLSSADESAREKAVYSITLRRRKNRRRQGKEKESFQSPLKGYNLPYNRLRILRPRFRFRYHGRRAR